MEPKIGMIIIMMIHITLSLSRIRLLIRSTMAKMGSRIRSNIPKSMIISTLKMPMPERSVIIFNLLLGKSKTFFLKVKTIKVQVVMSIMCKLKMTGI
jgi:hypothetical protein